MIESLLFDLRKGERLDSNYPMYKNVGYNFNRRTNVIQLNTTDIRTVPPRAFYKYCKLMGY
jgi:hypothetical protein